MPEPGRDWKDWLDRHGPALLLLARQYVPSHADAEDVVQEAFIRFWRAKTTVKDPTAYLFASIKSCSLDWQRGRRRQVSREEHAAKREAEPLFASNSEQHERQAAVEAALSELPADQSEVLVMKIWGELTFSQIAAALDLSPNTAASRYRYALAKLRETLAEEPTYE